MFYQSFEGKRANVQKQSSMNEELMSYERLKERENVRSNITKQASLNEEIIQKGSRAFEAFYGLSATRKFQILKSGLTNRIRQSTNSIEKVSGLAIKSSFAKILQVKDESINSKFQLRKIQYMLFPKMS